MSNNKKMFVSIGEASRATGISPHTLRKYADDNKIKSYKTPSGQRKFDINYLEKMYGCNFNNKQVKTSQKKNYIYTRVSSKKQIDDLSRQIEHIKSINNKYQTSSYIPISDIGSGMNFKRSGLQTILDACLQNIIGELIIAHRDRLSRFGFDLIESIVTKAGGKIIVINDKPDKSSEQELAEDLLSIVHIYSCRQMGKRKYRKQNIVEN